VVQAGQGILAPPLDSASRQKLDQLIRTAAAALTMVPLSDEQRRTVHDRMQAGEALKERLPP
jgi:hypothetical protein